MLSKLSLLRIASLRILVEKANTFYDRTHDFTSIKQLFVLDVTLNMLFDSEINHIRHFIKIPFINKGINFIDQPRKFRIYTVASSIPNDFEYKEMPIICYKYTKPIRSTIFQFNKLVAEYDIDTKTPDS